ncbi:adenylate/guanylate cyclase domain-containing protein [Bremerella sp. JC770]|uniref:adenylate/guanylate cyclase domain-containing protein n=1 Tax=Bremerella sp. JC770 TaxID=3232137 RepID=UPI003457BB73
MHNPHPRPHDPPGSPGVSLSIFVDGHQQPIYDDQLGQEVLELNLQQRIILGRQDVAKGDPGPFRMITFTDHRKLIITSFQQREVSRRSLDIAPDAGGNYLRVGNIGNHEVLLAPSSEGRIAHQQVRTFVVSELAHNPIRLLIGDNLAIQLRGHGVAVEPQFSEHSPTNISQSVADVALMIRQSQMQDGYATPSGPSGADVERILGAVSAVLEKAASSPDFFSSAAENVCKLGNFDSCSYLGLDQLANQWQCEATWPATDSGEIEGPIFDSQALEYIWSNRQTWSTPNIEGKTRSDERVVVTPVVSHEGVVGALYASKRPGQLGDDTMVDCEVKFVEVIRDCLTVGLERLRKEQEAAKHQVCLAQFFPPGIADRILYDETLLETREENITVLFCDIRGFSTISSALGSVQTLQWLREVLGELSESVIRHDGVLLEYVGDELVAMWGAPDQQPDHPNLACQAAIDMIGKLDQLNQLWSDRIPEDLLPFGLTIGINTGDCVVGKKGTDYKYMWGPLGPTVNIASRIQGATKQFCPKQERDDTGTLYCPPEILITESTRLGVTTNLRTRFLGTIKVVNIPEPVRVHELSARASGSWSQLRQNYEAAYRQFEERNFLEALNTLDVISKVEECQSDGPAKCLRDRALMLLQNPKLIGKEHPVWMLDQK